MKYAYKYKGTEHTLVQVEKNQPKIRVESWKTFDSNIEIKGYLFEEVKSSKEDKNSDKGEATTTTTEDLELTKLNEDYKAKFGNYPSNRYKNNKNRIISKLK